MQKKRVRRKMFIIKQGKLRVQNVCKQIEAQYG